MEWSLTTEAHQKGVTARYNAEKTAATVRRGRAAGGVDEKRCSLIVKHHSDKKNPGMRFLLTGIARRVELGGEVLAAVEPVTRKLEFLVQMVMYSNRKGVTEVCQRIKKPHPQGEQLKLTVSDQFGEEVEFGPVMAVAEDLADSAELLAERSEWWCEL